MSVDEFGVVFKYSRGIVIFSGRSNVSSRGNRQDFLIPQALDKVVQLFVSSVFCS